MKRMRVLSLSLFFLFVLAGVVSAASLPTNNPFRLEGGFTVDGSAPTGDHTFSAYVEGVLYKTIEMGADGYYVITVGGGNGDTVSLYVDGVLVYENVDFVSYGTYYRDVDVSVGSGSGGSGGSGSGGGGGGGSSSSTSSSGGGGGGSIFSSNDCEDGRDNDNDGLVDFPQDPGCEDENDDNEENPFVASAVSSDGSSGSNSITTGEAGADIGSKAATVGDGGQADSGLSAITGAVVGAVKDIGLWKLLFVPLVFLNLVFLYAYVAKRKKAHKESQESLEAKESLA